MKVPDICPRCQTNWIPNNESPGLYPGAISRTDNKTEICSDCGTEEALENFYEKSITPQSKWGLADH